MADKQAHLNGAYYGPAVPPPKHSYRPGRGSGCGCGCCLLSLLLKIIATIVVIVGLAVLIVWLIFRPINKVKFHVTDVSLTQFNLSTSQSLLDYNLALNISVRNPNKKIGVYYDRIEARAYYDDQRLQSIWLTPFYQGHKNTSVLSTVFKGQQLLLGEELQEFNEEKNTGVYSIDVKLYLRVRFKFGKIKTPRFRPRINCELKVPLNSSTGRLAGGAETTRCDVDL